MSQRLFIILASLIFLAIGLSNFWVYIDNNPERQIEIIESRINNLSATQLTTLENLSSELSENSDPFKVYINSKGSLRVYDNGSLIYWNDNKQIPQYSKLKQLPSNYVISYEGSIYLIGKKTTVYNQNSLLEYFSIIPLYKEYPLSNEYLTESWNQDIFQGVQVKYQPEIQNIQISDQSYTGLNCWKLKVMINHG